MSQRDMNREPDKENEGLDRAKYSGAEIRFSVIQVLEYIAFRVEQKSCWQGYLGLGSTNEGIWRHSLKGWQLKMDFGFT